MTSPEFFKNVFRSHAKGLPVVLYRMPGDDRIHAYVQSTTALHVFDSVKVSGFVFAPFHDGSPAVMLPFDQCVHYSCLVTQGETISTKSEVQKQLEGGSHTVAEKEQHIALVEKAKALILANEADKIVVARQEKLKLDDFQIATFFKRMERMYTNAFIYLWAHPAIGTWAGATPERLFSLEEQKFSATALAGTQIWHPEADKKWTSKEIKEQQFVTDYIAEAVKGFVNLKQVSKPKTVKAGNLAHIRTDLQGTVCKDAHITDLIGALHPTPATCGLPMQIAKDFILEHESFDRRYYTGYLGLIDNQESTNLFVNLRCVEITESEAVLYIGGGITAESDSLKEWEETLAKAETMKRVLK